MNTALGRKIVAGWARNAFSIPAIRSTLDVGAVAGPLLG
jgi:hypothetical protein